MANEDIGDIECAWCHTESPVRKRKDKKLYVMCPNCGQQFLNGPGGQDIILERATIYGVSSAPKPAATPEKPDSSDVATRVAAPQQPESPQIQPEPEQKKSWFDDFLS